MPNDLNDDTKAKLAEEAAAEEAKAAEAKAAEEAAALAAKAEADKSGLPDITLDEDAKKAAAELAEKNKAKEDSELNKTVSKTLAGAGYTEEILTARLIKDDGISDEFIEELKGKVDPDFIDAHVGRLRAEIELAKVKESGRIDEVRAKEKATKDMNDHIYNTVGGKDKFTILGKTLKEKLSTEDLAALNVKLASGNKVVVNEALTDAVKKYNDIRGMGGALMEGDAFSSTEAPEHLTKEEYRAVMRTEKYKTDPKFARKIDEDRLKTRKADSERYPNGQYYGFHPTKGRYNL